MSHDLHITRAGHWSDSRSRPIKREEWLGLVERDPQLRLDVANGECFARFLPEAGKPAKGWMDWSQGRVFAKKPPYALATKMVTLAAELGAVVQQNDGQPFTLSQPQPSRQAPSPSSPSAAEGTKAAPGREEAESDSLSGRLSGAFKSLFRKS